MCIRDRPYGITAINIDIMHKKNRQTLVWDNIPEWAIFALEYGIEEELFITYEDKDLITRFIGENFPNGYTCLLYTSICSCPGQ